MPHRYGSWAGIGLLLVGCGAPVPTLGPAGRPSGLMGLPTTPGTTAPDALDDAKSTHRVVIAFRTPRTSFSSDKVDLRTGKTLPMDDGMGPEGDLSFFFDGSRFQAIANSGGGSTRTLAPAESGRAVGEFAMAPVVLREGSELLLKQGQQIYHLRITRLTPGSMTFLPSGLGAGTGFLDFSYQLKAH